MIDVTTLTWDPPGPGSWSQQPDHFPRPVTAAMARTLPIWGEATAAWIRALGMPIAAAHMVPINGLPYVSFEFEGGDSQKVPPAWLLRVMARVVPSMRRAERQAARTLSERPWIEATQRWYRTERAVAIERMTALTRVELRALDDIELAQHLSACAIEVERSVRQHYELHGHDEPPVYLFALAMHDWGVDVPRAMSLLAGSSPASTGTSPELEALRAAAKPHPRPGTIDELRSLSPQVGAALDAYLERYGWGLVDGYDVDGPCLAEMPELILRLALDAGPVDSGSRSPTDLADEMRMQLDPAHRAEFDQKLAEARASYGLRDDNGGILVAWPIGLLRRVMLVAGQRLAERGLFAMAELAIEATPEELSAALLDVTTPDSAELIHRAAFRAAVRAEDAPATLGPPEPPSPKGYPGALGVIIRAFDLGLAPAAPREALHGIGIGSETYEGRARLVTGRGQGLAEFEPGEVLIATMTSPSYNAVLSLAGALVTETGDNMSHAAIMARELGIPAVIGAPSATTAIRDGDLVTVNPVSGQVQVRSKQGALQ